MSVSAEYRAYVLEQLERIRPVTARNMFSGVGIYADGSMFALLHDDALYLKADDENRPALEAVGATAFRPYGDNRMMHYYELAGERLEDVDELRDWVDGAVGAALRARTKKRRR